MGVGIVLFIDSVIDLGDLLSVCLEFGVVLEVEGIRRRW